MTSSPLSSGTPSIALMPFSHRIGLATVVRSTRSSSTGSRRAAIEPANPTPIGTLTPWRTSSSSPRAARATRCVRPVLDEQHGRGVGVEDGADAFQQLDEQVVDVQAGQVRVGQRRQRLEALVAFAFQHGASVEPDAGATRAPHGGGFANLGRCSWTSASRPTPRRSRCRANWISRPPTSSRARSVTRWPADSRRIVLDLSGVRFIDSSGISALLGVRAAAAEASAVLQLGPLSARVAEVLRFTGVDPLFDAVDP